MASLFDKITTLINAQVSDLLGQNPQSPLARIKLNAEDAEKNPRASLRTFQQRLDEALRYEDELQAKIEALMQQALDLDGQVDRLLRAGDELTARRVQGQLNMKQQQLAIAESELRDHRLLSRHLMQEMRALENALEAQDGAAGGRKAGGVRIPVDGVASAGNAAGKSILGTVSDRFSETRSSIESRFGSAPAAGESAKRYDRFEVIDEEPDPRRAKPQKHPKDDMNARLSRLSKPDDES